MNKLLTLCAVSAALAFSAPAFADSDKGLPVDELVAAIQAAVRAQPGRVKDVEVKDRRNGTPIVEVEIVAADGRTHEIRIDTTTRAVVR